MKKILLIALLILCGCDRYELTEDESGRVIRLDKRTGETTIIEDDKSAEEAASQELLKAKEWPVTFLGDDNLEPMRFVTSWREGSLHYRVTLPYLEPPKRYGWDVKFYLRDEGTLLLLAIPSRMSAYKGVTDEADEFVGMELDGKVRCSESTYRGIESIAVEFFHY